jgi:hypothetical protein
MHINTWRGLIWVVDVLLVLGAGYVVWSVNGAKSADAAETAEFHKKLVAEIDAIRVDPPKPAPRVGVAAFKGVSLSGEVERPKPSTAPAVEAAPAPFEPLENLMKVVSIQYATDQDDAKVALFPKSAPDQPNEQVIFGVRDLVFFARGAIIKEIRQREVVFEYPKPGETAILKIQTEPPRTGAPPVPTPGGVGAASAKAQLETGVVYKPDSSTLTVKREGRAALESEGQRILESATVETTDLPEGGQGLKIASMQQGSELAKWGVETGDILVSVNGVAMSGKSEVVNYVKNNPKLGEYRVVFMRRGARLTRIVAVEH